MIRRRWMICFCSGGFRKVFGFGAGALGLRGVDAEMPVAAPLRLWCLHPCWLQYWL